MQPDSLISDPFNPQAWNRYSYVKNNPVNFNDPTGHFECNDPHGCNGPDDDNAESGVVIGGGGNHDNDDDEDIEDELQQDSCTYHLCSEDSNLYELGWQNFGQAWSIYTNPSATYWQRYGAGTYMGAWGGAHIIGVAGLFLLTREAIIIAGANYFTNNPDAARVSIGNYPAYIKDGYTYFSGNNVIYKALDTIGLAQPMNKQFMLTQIEQAKPMDVIITSAQPGIYTVMEMAMLQASKLYTVSTQFSPDFTGIINIFTP